MSGQDWFPTLIAAAGNPNITQELLAGKQLGGKTYKVHLDGYDQLPMLTGTGQSARREIFYFDEADLGAVRIDDFKYTFIDQPEGWFGPKVKVNWPVLVNLRLDPFERSCNGQSPPYIYDFFAHEFWRFTYVQEEVAKLAATAIDFPPMQAPASFNLDEVKKKIEARSKLTA